MTEVVSRVEVEIERPLGDVAELLADPANNPAWMEDVDYEPLMGEPGMPGSTYRLIPKNHEERLFVATVLTRQLPKEVSLILRAEDVDVTVVARMSAMHDGGTKLAHEEVFALKAMGNAPVPEAVQSAMRTAHRSHVAAFKAFAERPVRPGRSKPH